MSVHNGVEQPFVESITIGTNIRSPIQLSYEGRPDLPNACRWQQSIFVQRLAKKTPSFIRANSTSVEGFQTVWLFNDGQLMAFNNILPEGQQVYAAVR